MQLRKAHRPGVEVTATNLPIQSYRASFVRRLRRGLVPYAFLLPDLAIFATFVVVPAGLGVTYSLTRWNGVGPMHYVGFSNYRTILTDPAFWHMLIRTTLYVVGTVGATYALALLLAQLLVADIRGRNFFRMLFYLPAVLSFIVVGVAWRWMLSSDFGVMNYLLGLVHIGSVAWLESSFFANVAIILVSVWALVGFYMVIFIAALQSVPKEYYEASMIDGAKPWKQFTHITLPLLKPTSLLVIVLCTIDSFKVYGLAYALTQGGPGQSTTYYVQTIYQYGFNIGNLGYASAASTILFVIVGILTVIQLRIGRAAGGLG